MRKNWFANGSVGQDEQLVNLTPLIDVVFVVLITFILVAPLLKLDRIQLAGVSGEQKKESVSTQKISAIAIRVYADDHISLNEQALTVGELGSRLKELKVKLPDAIPEVFQDKKATFGSYQGVKNALEIAGYSEMDLILKTE